MIRSPSVSNPTSCSLFVSFWSRNFLCFRFESFHLFPSNTPPAKETQNSMFAWNPEPVLRAYWSGVAAVVAGAPKTWVSESEDLVLLPEGGSPEPTLHPHPYCCVHSLLLLIMHALILSLCNFVWGIKYISLAIRFWHLFVIIPAHAITTPNPPIPCSWHCPDCLRWSESLFHGIGLRTCSVGWWRRSSLFVFFLTGSRVSLIKRIREMRKPLLNGTERKNLIIILPFYSVKFKEAGT